MIDVFGWQPTRVRFHCGGGVLEVEGDVRLRATEGGAEVRQVGRVPVTMTAEYILTANVDGATALDRRQHSLAAAAIYGYVDCSAMTPAPNHFSGGEVSTCPI